MSEKPEALRLSEELYAFHAAKKEMPSVSGQMLGFKSYRIVATGEAFSQILDAAAELRRLHAENERLNAVALQAQNAAIDLTKKNERLREALHGVDEFCQQGLNSAEPVHWEAALHDIMGLVRAALRQEV